SILKDSFNPQLLLESITHLQQQLGFGRILITSRDGTVWLQLQRLDDGSVQLDNRAEGYALRIESIDMAGQDR
ncbi:hypothetical protein BMR86_21470, partial [Stenotrophomonas sp. KAs 5-3]